MDFVIADVTSQDGDLLARRFDIYYIPVFFILDGKGNIVNRIEYGAVEDRPENKLDTYINRALGAK